MVSLLDRIPRALELAMAWKGDGRPSCGQAAETTSYPIGPFMPGAYR
jgi:hypothetical protein